MPRRRARRPRRYMRRPLTIRIEPAVWDWLDRQARLQDRSVSALVRQALQQYLRAAEAAVPLEPSA